MDAIMLVEAVNNVIVTVNVAIKIPKPGHLAKITKKMQKYET